MHRLNKLKRRAHGSGKHKTIASPRYCYICLEPCVPGTDRLVTREDALTILSRSTADGIRVDPGEPYTTIVRGTHYARPTAFDCPSCDACLCCLCTYPFLMNGIRYLQCHPLVCACGKVSLITKKTVLFLSSQEEQQLLSRCDEWNCSDPLYCPDPACSAYVPTLTYLLPGSSKDDEGDEDGTDNKVDNDKEVNKEMRIKPRVACLQCRKPICTQCKGFANDLAHSDPNEPCTRPNIHNTPELLQVISKSAFKRW
ncbi:MAG: hypothetical protein STHCBS139747_000220 [Sporothrix thermara]